jgi:iron complex transport system permease protein
VITRSASATPETRYRVGFSLTVLTVILIVAILTSTLIGEVPISVTEAWRAVASRFGIEIEATYEAVFWSIRVPRVLAAVVVGGVLGAAGSAIQGVYRNPMADPYLLGVSSAAGLGAALAISVTPAGTPSLVAIGAAAGAGALFALATRLVNRATLDPARFILVGTMLGISLFAWTVILVFVQNSPRLPTFTYFVFGSLGGITWGALWSANLLAAGGLVIAMIFLRELDLLALGEREAGQLGVPVTRVVALVLVGAGIAVGASVGLIGVVGFVGLLGPLVARSLVGPSHRHLVPAAALAGAIFVVAADVAARWIAGSVEIPIGIVTAAVGGPVLAWLLGRRRAEA